MRSSRGWALLAVWVIALGAITLGCALLVASSIPYEPLKARVDLLALDRSVAFFSPDFYDRTVGGLRLASGVLLVGGGVLLALHRAASRFLSALGSSCREEVRASCVWVSRWLRSESRWHLAGLGLVLLVGALLRVAFVSQPMRYDESYTYMRFVTQPLLLALTNYSAPNNHIFHTVLVSLSVSLFGNAPWAIRLPALVAGIAIIPATYAMARAFHNKQAALLAAALVASSSALIEFSANARGYTMMGLFALVSFAIAPRLARSSSPALWLVFVICSVLGLYTVPVMLYPFGSVVVWLIFAIAVTGNAHGRVRALVPLAVSIFAVGVLTLLLYTPVLVTFGLSGLAGNQFVASQAWPTFLAETARMLVTLGGQWTRDIPLMVQWLLVAGMAATLILDRRASSQSVAPVVALLLWCVPVVVLQRAVTYRRVWLFALPVFLTASAAGIGAIARWLSRGKYRGQDVLAVTIALLTVLSLGANVWRTKSVLMSTETETLRDAPAIVEYLSQHLSPGDRVLAAAPADTILEYYFTRTQVPATHLLSDVQTASTVWIVTNDVAQGPEQSLGRLLAGVGLADRAGGVELVHAYPFARLYRLAG